MTDPEHEMHSADSATPPEAGAADSPEVLTQALESSVEQTVSPNPPRAARNLALASIVLVLGMAAGFGLRWLVEPAPPAAGEAGLAEKKIESLSAELQHAKDELAAAHQTEPALPKAEAVPALEPGVSQPRQIVASAQPPAKPVQAMECDLTGSKEKIALALKGCVQQFDNLNRR